MNLMEFEEFAKQRREELEREVRANRMATQARVRRDGSAGRTNGVGRWAAGLLSVGLVRVGSLPGGHHGRGAGPW